MPEERLIWLLSKPPHLLPFFCCWWKACQEKHEGLPGTREKFWILGLDPPVVRSGWVQSRNPDALNWAGHESSWQQFHGKQLVTPEHIEQLPQICSFLQAKKKSARCLVMQGIFSWLHAVLIVVVEYSEQELHFSCLSSLKDFPKVKVFSVCTYFKKSSQQLWEVCGQREVSKAP